MTQRGTTDQDEHAGSEFLTEGTLALEAFRRSVREVIEASGESTDRAVDIQRLFDVDTSLGWQLHRIATHEDLISIGAYVPGKKSWSRFLSQARLIGVGDPLCRNADDSYGRLNAVISKHARDKIEFDTLVDGEAKAPVDSLQSKYRRQAYRANRFVWGQAADTKINTFIVQPSESGDLIDIVVLSAQIGLRRFRRSIRRRISTVKGVARPGGPDLGTTVSTIDSAQTPPESQGSDSVGFVLKALSSPDLPPIETVRDELGNYSAYFDDVELGENSVLSYYVGAKLTNADHRYSKDTIHDSRLIVGLSIPTQQQIVDVLIRSDTFASTELRSTIVGDPAHYGDAYTWDQSGVLPLEAPFRHLGSGIQSIPSVQGTDYLSSLKYVFKHTGWAPDGFDTYRFVLSHPPISSQVVVHLGLSPDVSGT